MISNTGFPPFATAFPGIDAVGSHCQISSSVTVMRASTPGGQRAIRLGDEVMLFDHVRLLLGDNNTPADTGLYIGNRVVINVGSYISGEGGLVINDDVLIGASVHILSADHGIHRGDVIISRNPLVYGVISIGKGAWIGANSTLLKGVSIGEGAVVGAGSVVTRSVPPLAVAVGNPARVVRYRGGFPPKRWWPVFQKAAK